jgi:ferredoxin
MLRRIRRTLAVVTFVPISLLFLDFTGTLHRWLGWLARLQFVPAVLALNAVVVGVLVLLTFLLGRAYCSCWCPLGVLQDLISWFAGRRRKNRFSYLPPLNTLRLAILALFVISLLFGIGSVFVVLEPYGAYGRIVSNLLVPIYSAGNNLLAYFAARIDSYAFYHVDVWIRSIASLVVALVTLGLSGVLSWKYGRLYCNTVCPVGTLLGIASKWALLKPRIDLNRCNGCGRCAKNCKGSCIDSGSQRVDYSRCVACMNCLNECPKQAISYRAASSNANRPAIDRPLGALGASRRQALTLLAVAATSTTARAKPRKVAQTDGGLAAIPKRQPAKRTLSIVPAGANGIENFERRCTACQLCVSVCPNQILRPSTNRAAHLMQPELTFEHGYCRPECTKCSEVCPTGAIHRITASQKAATQIGRAQWYLDRCIIKVDGVSCDSCARHCPTSAIRMVLQDPSQPKGARFPVIDVERCIGCGACEYLCPSRPVSAIRVEGQQRHRLI